MFTDHADKFRHFDKLMYFLGILKINHNLSKEWAPLIPIPTPTNNSIENVILSFNSDVRRVTTKLAAQKTPTIVKPDITKPSIQST